MDKRRTVVPPRSLMMRHGAPTLVLGANLTRRSERGAVLVLTLFFACGLILMCFGITTLSAAHGARQDIQARADGAALAAVDTVTMTDRIIQNDQVEGDGVPHDDVQPSVTVDDSRRAARRFVAQVAPADRVAEVATADGRTVAVTLTTDWALPWFGDALGVTINLTAQGSARILVVDADGG